MRGISKYPKIKHFGDGKTRAVLQEGECYIQEKLDGANCRAYVTDEGELVFGSRNVVFTEKEEPLPIDEINGQFRGAARFVEKNIDVEQVKNWERFSAAPLSIYGEAMHRHTLDYDWDNVPEFVGFDVARDGPDQRFEFLHPENATRFFEDVGLPYLDVYQIGIEELHDLSYDELAKRESEYRDGTAEGVVIKNPDTRTYAKAVREKFKEKMEQTMGKSQKKARRESEEELFVATYATNQRIEKQIWRLIDEGSFDEVRREMMSELPMMVVEDIWEEEYRELVRKNWMLDLKEARSLVAKRCLGVIDLIRTREMQRAVKNGGDDG